MNDTGDQVVEGRKCNANDHNSERRECSAEIGVYVFIVRKLVPGCDPDFGEWRRRQQENVLRGDQRNRIATNSNVFTTVALMSFVLLFTLRTFCNTL